MSRGPSSSRPVEGSLAAALQLAAAAVSEVARGTALPAALNQLASGARPDTRGAAQDIAYRCIRSLGRVDAALAALASRPPEPPLLGGLLRCALALLLDPKRPYEPYTVVDQAVAAAASDKRLMPARGMVNAVLRRALREEQVLTEIFASQPRARWNYPEWWIAAAQAAWPQHWETLLEVGNQPPPLTLRVNTRRNTTQACLAMLEQAGMEATIIGPQALRLKKPVPVGRIPGFEQGLVSVQDAAAQLAAPLLDLQDGQRVLDACAAPGGKTGHMLELADLDLTAMDVDATRLIRVQENLDRLQRSARLLTGDAAGRDWWDGQPFDRILADVPCTASGIVRRHPDIRWLRRPTDTGQLAARSAAILDNLWGLLAPGGKMLLVTCSVWPEESALQAAAFAARTGAMPLPAPGQLLPEADLQQDHDGLFYALFQKAPV